MRKINLSIIALFVTSTLLAQSSMDQILHTIEQNNTTLKALRETADAEKLENKSGITLPDPELGFNYQIGRAHV